MKLCVFENGTCVACGTPQFNRRQICAADGRQADTQGRAGFESPQSIRGGPGTELSKLLKRFGVEPTPTCPCREMASKMDALGCDECSRPERIDEVVAVMREEAQARGLPFLDAAGRLLVRRAISNARRAAV